MRFFAFVFDLLFCGFFFFLPLILGSVPIASVAEGPVPYVFFAFVLFWAYHFFFYFFLGLTLGDSLCRIYLSPESMGFGEAFFYSLIKTFFTFLPLNLLFFLFDREGRTVEQLLYGYRYLRMA